MKWTRKTAFGEFKPYVSEDGEFMVADLSMNSQLVPEYCYLKTHNWDSKETHEKFLTYCRENKLRLDNANWIVVNTKTGEKHFPFKTAKAAKEYAESI